MIYRLEIENFYSIRDQQVVDLTVGAKIEDPEARFAPLFPGSDLRVPKTVAVFGANGSGKTTLLRALQFMVQFVRASVGAIGPGFPCQRFNDVESSSRPIKLAMEFAGAMDLSPDAILRHQQGDTPTYGCYRYELVIVMDDGVPAAVGLEALRQKPGGKGKWQRVFERNGQDVTASADFTLSGYRHLLNTLAPNVSLLSSFARFQHPPSMEYVRMSSLVFGNLADERPSDEVIVELFKSAPEMVEALNARLSRIDVGVESMRLAETHIGLAPVFQHYGLQHEMPWALESHGTRAFIKLFPSLALALASGGVAVVDEFDTFLHPLMVPEILNWFNDPRQNIEGAQLWVSCHSTMLLEDLAKEQVVLCEKDRTGRTHAFSLMDVQGVRRDENLFRKYMSGTYGALPRFG